MNKRLAIHFEQKESKHVFLIVQFYQENKKSYVQDLIKRSSKTVQDDLVLTHALKYVYFKETKFDLNVVINSILTSSYEINSL